jgi:hypothetical protein
MTKSGFITEAKQLGFEKHEELVALLKKPNGKSYNKRTLSRYKIDEALPEKFLKAFSEYKVANAKVAKPKVAEVAEVTEEPEEVETPQTEFEQMDEAEEKARCEAFYENHTKVEKPIVGIGIDISNEDYHNSNNMGVSKLKVLIENAKEFEARYISKTVEQKDTDALIVGKLHHTLVLEPHRLKDDYIVIDMKKTPVKADWVAGIEALGGQVSLRENSKQEFVVADTVEELKEAFEELKAKEKRTICTKAHLELAQQTSKKALNSWFQIVVRGKPVMDSVQLKDLLKHDKCYVEKTFYGTINGENVQVRPDILINMGKEKDIWFVIDLKTLEVATPQMFVKQGGQFFWDMQEAFYCDVLAQNGINVQKFYFNCAGKKEFSGASFYDWGVSTREDAKKIVKAGMNKYKYCMESKIFLESRFDYVQMKFDEITTLDVPAYRQHQMGDLGA